MEKETLEGIVWDDFWWTKQIEMEFDKKKYDVQVLVCADENETVADIQKESYEVFMEKYEELQPQIIEQVFEYYVDIRHELGYDKEENVNYPEVEALEITKMLELTDLFVERPDTVEEVYGGARTITLRFACTWDEENGLGVLFLNEKIEDIGPDVGL